MHSLNVEKRKMSWWNKIPFGWKLQKDEETSKHGFRANHIVGKTNSLVMINHLTICSRFVDLVSISSMYFHIYFVTLCYIWLQNSSSFSLIFLYYFADNRKSDQRPGWWLWFRDPPKTQRCQERCKYMLEFISLIKGALWNAVMQPFRKGLHLSHFASIQSCNSKFWAISLFNNFVKSKSLAMTISYTLKKKMLQISIFVDLLPWKLCGIKRPTRNNLPTPLQK